MGENDKSNHVYINLEGNTCRITKEPFDWIIHFYNQKTEGHALDKYGHKRRTCFKINPTAELQEAKEAYNNYKNSKHGLDEKTAKNVFSKLEHMVKYGIKNSEVYY